jgi:hypothetical protein
MSETVGAYWWEARFVSRPNHDLGHAAGGQCSMWSAYAQEHLPMFGRRAHSTQVAHDRQSHVDRQRQAFTTVAFASHKNLSAPPVEVIQLQGNEFASTKTQTNEHRQHSEVARTDCGPTVTGGQQLLYLASRQSFGKACEA